MFCSSMRYWPQPFPVQMQWGLRVWPADQVGSSEAISSAFWKIALKFASDFLCVYVCMSWYGSNTEVIRKYWLPPGCLLHWASVGKWFDAVLASDSLLGETCLQTGRRFIAEMPLVVTSACKLAVISLQKCLWSKVREHMWLLDIKKISALLSERHF